MRYIKYFENNFVDRMGDNLYHEFSSTYDIPGEVNSSVDFCESHKVISPSKIQLENSIELAKSILGNKIHHYEYMTEFRQLYIYMWSNKTHMSFIERDLSNRKTIIIDFYTDNWIFVSVCDDDSSHREIHFVCDDMVGLEKFLNDKKRYLINKSKD